MARRPKPKASEVKEASSGFVDALKFIGLVAQDKGPPNETHVYLGGHWAAASNGLITVAHKIEEDIYACPHNHLMLQALSKCGKHYSLTQLDESRLSIKSDKFKAIVPCINPNDYYLAPPDPPLYDLNEAFVKAIHDVNVFPVEANAQRVPLVSILLNGQTVVGTNAVVMIEAYHGLDLPKDVALPTIFIETLFKTQKKLTKFGLGNSSATFYFQDDSWLKTQLFTDKWPDIEKVFPKSSNPFPVLPDFFNGLAAIAPFAEEGLAYFDSDCLRTHKSEALGASYEVKGLPRGPIFPIKQLMLLKPWVEQIDFLAPGARQGTTCLMAFGKTQRGVIAGRE